MKNKKLLIITGVQRSGNSLLAKIIGNHSKVKMELDPSLTTIFNSHNLLLKNIKNSEFGDEKYVQDRIISNFNYWHPERFDHFDFSNWNKDTFQDYINYKVQDSNYEFLGSKMPDYCNNLEEIDLLADNVQYINVIRDPRNVVYSQISKINASLIEAVAHWKHSFYKSSYYNVIFGEKKYLNIKYEDLIRNPKSELLKVCKFLEIEFEHAMLNLNDSETRTESSYVIPYFDKSKFKAYQKSLSLNEIKKIESLCFYEMKNIGYKLDNENLKPKIITRGKLYFDSLKKNTTNLFITNKLHMSGNKLNKIKIPFKTRFLNLLKTFFNIIIPKGLLEIILKNDRLYK